VSGERRIVSDTGPLISLERLSEGYAFIGKLYDRFIVPRAVLEEVARGPFEGEEAYLQHYDIEDLIEVRAVTSSTHLPASERLHEGETQAILLAIELGLPLLIEETIGRQVARQAGVPISGVAGQIIRAYRQSIISAQEARSKLREMRQEGRINQHIYERLINAMESKA